MSDLPDHLIAQVQNYTGAPWWNGEAYDQYHGLSASILETRKRVGEAVDDLADVIEWLKAEKQFDKADRLRTIAGRLAGAQSAR